MDRLKYPLDHEWHVAINHYSYELRKVNRPHESFMYEAKKAADEVPRLIALFKAERDGKLRKTHKQCSQQESALVEDNHLTCCLGVKCRECPFLLALDKIDRCKDEDIDTAKAWTCATHIVSKGGDFMGEGYILTVDDRMFWDNVHQSLAAEIGE